ncbi:MAG: esterase family protein [Pyrinomonadaceae bacterium]|nr:esterase family protein [Pyrinomonadaceae bacterium]
MKLKQYLLYLPFIFILALPTLTYAQAAGTPANGGLRFKVELGPAVSSSPVSGRLLIFMTLSTEAMESVQPSFFELDKVWIAATEIRNLAPGKAIEINADDLAYPGPFSTAPTGDYQIMALLDVDHSFPYSEMGPGDLRSIVVGALGLKPAETPPLKLVLTKRVEDEHPIADTESIKLVTFQSPALSAFWGRPIMMRAGVLLPASYASSGKARYPVVYRIHGFGGSHEGAWRSGPGLLKKMTDGALPEMINVYLDGSCPMGHHEFADSANNGPWGQALTKEFIPYLERKFRMDGLPRGRLLTGHSSGGWSTLWLQVNYPDVFGGTWSTSPDPVDFRSFSGADLTKLPPENFYNGPGGKPRNIFRFKGRDIFSWYQFAHFARVVGEYGGQIESFEAVFSPRGEDGRPMPLFDRDTGSIDPFVQKAWDRYDISRLLVANWKSLGPKLRGKLHLVVGTADNFHLEEAVYILRDTLKGLGSDATFEIIEGRDHMDLFQGDLNDRLVRDMYKVARPAAKSKRP